MDTILKITNLHAGYVNRSVIRGISLSATRGKITAIIGPNGCGKSTLLKSVYHLCQIYSGSIIYNSKNITKYQTENMINQKISYVPQGKLLFNNLTVRENLELSATYAKTDINKSVSSIFDTFTFLKYRKNEYPFNLSGGQQQALSLSMALVQNPTLLLLDEPSLGLSPKTTNQIFKIIKSINKLGITIILIEQNIRQALNIADTCYILKNGKIHSKGEYKSLNDRQLLYSYFGMVK